MLGPAEFCPVSLEFVTRRHDAKTLAERTIRDAREDRIVGVAAEVAFFALLAIPPMLLVLAGFAGYIRDLFGADVADGVRDWVTRGLGGFLAPDTMDESVRPTIDAVFSRGRGTVLSIGAVLAIWSASRLVRVLIEAMNVAYGVGEWRPWWRRRLVALGLTAGGVLVIAVFLPLVVAGPRLGPAVADRLRVDWLATVWPVLYWPAAATLGVLLLAVLYHVAPNWQTPWRRDIPGAVLAAAGWLAGAGALRLYVRYTITDADLGPLAAPLVLLLWFYVSSFVVLLGAELNAEIEKMWPTAGTGPKDPVQSEPDLTSGPAA